MPICASCYSETSFFIYLSKLAEFPFDASVKSSPDKGTLFNMDMFEVAELLDKIHTDAVSLPLLLCSFSFLMIGDDLK